MTLRVWGAVERRAGWPGGIAFVTDFASDHALRKKRKGRSHIAWALATVAPWCLGVALSASFPAGAGQDPSVGDNWAPVTGMPALQPADLIPSELAPAHNGRHRAFVAPFANSLAAPSLSGLSLSHAHTSSLGGIQMAALTAGGDYRDLEFRTLPDETEPRLQLKNGAKAFPRIDASRKSDPLVGLRPTFDARLRSKGTFARFAAEHQMLFNRDVLAFEGFSKQDEDDSDNGALQPSRDYGANPSTGPGVADRPPSSAAGVTHSPRSVRRAELPALISLTVQRHFDGSTPRVPRAVALSSMTPVPAGNVQIISARDLLPGDRETQNRETTVAGRTELARPNYAQLIEHAKSPAQQHCLAQAIYFEARSEPEAGQAAVAQVVLNRALSGLYPPSVCGVVFQNSHRHLACQFTFTCEGKSLRINDQGSWERARRIAREVLEGKTYLSQVGASTHYHATYVRPGWSRRLQRKGKIGTHIFYKLKPGQT